MYQLLNNDRHDRTQGLSLNNHRYDPSLTKRGKRTFVFCIAASLCCHIFSLLFLQRHSLWYFSPTAVPKEASYLASMDRPQKDKILKEAFLQSPTKTEKESAVEPVRVDILLSFQPVPILPKIGEEEKGNTSFHSTAPLSCDKLLSDHLEISFNLPSLERFNLFEHLPKDLILPSPAPLQQALERAPLLSKTAIAFSREADLDLSQTPPVAILYPNALLSPPLTDLGQKGKFPIFAPLPHLPDLPTLAELETASYSEFFDTEIVFTSLEEGEGYLFAVTLIPHQDLDLPKMRQHYSFLIDRSNSIQKERLSAVKAAIIKALEELELDDSFNIISFDSHVERLDLATLPATSSTIQKAKAFLDQIHLGSFFSPANLSKPLAMTLPSQPDEGIHTAILFTDGETLGKKAVQRDLALDWTAYNNGRVALFAVGLGGDSHLETLDCLAAFNRGKVLYAPTKKGIKRKLLKLIKTIGHPIAKDLSIRAVSCSPTPEIHLYPDALPAPHLYLNEPYVVLGTTKTLDDFILFVQGRIGTKWLNIKKNVSFVNAKKGGGGLKSQLALQKAYWQYICYLYDLNPAHLAEAQAILDPYEIKVAFQ